MATTLEAFVPALIVVDFQEDFCPPVRAFQGSYIDSWLCQS